MTVVAVVAVIVAGVTPNITDEANSRSVPVITTVSPPVIGPCVSSNDVIDGPSR